MLNIIKRWAPSMILMAVIFGFSSMPSANMPRFGNLDFFVKKFGHALGYGLLASANLHGFQFSHGKVKSSNITDKKLPERKTISPVVISSTIYAWLMTIIYSVLDEYHQSYVPGRNPSLWDIFLFDNIGAIFGLWLYTSIRTNRTRQAYSNSNSNSSPSGNSSIG